MLLAFSRCIMSLPLVMNLMPAKTMNIAAMAVAMYFTKLYTFHTGCNIWSNAAVSVVVLGGIALAALTDNTVVRSIKLIKTNIGTQFRLWLDPVGGGVGMVGSGFSFFGIGVHLQVFNWRVNRQFLNGFSR